jgi:hypothetical protein
VVEKIVSGLAADHKVIMLDLKGFGRSRSHAMAVRCFAIRPRPSRRDRIVPLAIAQRLAEALPTANLKILDRCGHVPQEEEPELTAANSARSACGFGHRQRVGEAAEPAIREHYVRMASIVCLPFSL